MQLRIASAVLFAAAWLLPRAVAADRFVLAGGGIVEGELLNRDQTPRTRYDIRTAAGVRMVLPADAIAEVSRQKKDEPQYAAIAPTYEDTIDAQWQLAEWCRQHNLMPQRQTHLRRILELDPDHIGARRGLGYVQFKGQWTTRAETLESKGYTLYRGKFRSPQDIALIEEREKAKLAERDWLGRLKRWRVELNDPRFAPAAYERIAAIRDASAIAPLCELLAVEPSREVKTLYVETLGAIGTAEAIQAIVQLSLNDADVEIFHACAETLARIDPPNLQEPYLKALPNQNNVRLNRAANMLGRIGDRSAIGPLIDVLISTHRVVVAPSSSGKGDAISTSFSNDGGNSFQTGEAQKSFAHTVQNSEVLDALTRLSGQSFGYDQAAWQRWHAVERSRGPAVELKK